MEKGYIQVYTGDGKGKTTAALGLGLRATGRGYKVKMFQFMKGCETGELDSVQLLNGLFDITRLGETKKFFFNMNEEEKVDLKEKLKVEVKQVIEVLEQSSCDILILDEIMSALHSHMMTVEEVLGLIDKKPEGMELVLTGRSAPQAIQEKADLVTEMRSVKHYMNAGVPARVGIEK